MRRAGAPRGRRVYYGDALLAGDTWDDLVDSSSVRSLAATALAVALYLPNLVVYAGGMVLGANLGLGADGDLSGAPGSASWAGDSAGLWSGGLPAVYYAVPLLVCGVALAVGVRHALRRPPAEPLADRWWDVPALFTSAWLVLWLLTRMTMEVSGGGTVLGRREEAGGTVTFGLGLATVLLMSAFWGLLSGLGARWAAPTLVAAYPRLATRLAGSRAHPQWQLRLADLLARSGRQQPPRLAGASSALAAGQAPEVPPLTARPALARRLVLAVLAVAAVLAVGLVGRAVLISTVYSPESVVEDYFDALGDRDADRALGLVEPDSLKGVDRALLTSRVLSDQKLEVSVRSSNRVRKLAAVEVEVEGQRTSYLLERDGSVAGLLPRWRLRAPFSALTVRVDRSSGSQTPPIQVNGVDLPATDVSFFHVFPGRYKVSTQAQFPYVGQGSEVTAVGAGATARISVSLDPEVTSKAQQAVNAHVDECAKSTVAAPPGCPFRSYSDMLSAKWSVVSYPTVDVRPSFYGDGLRVSTQSSGVVRLTGREPGFFGSSPRAVDRQVSFYVSGELTASASDRSLRFEPGR